MTFNQINYFLAIVECGTFSNAAEEMYISQSSLSKQIKSLELELGVSLFQRSGNKISITPAGSIFYEYAKTVKKHHQEMLLQLADFKEGQFSSVRLGTLPLLYGYGLATKLAKFQVAHQLTHIDLLEREQVEIMHLLDNGSLDLAIARIDLLSPESYDFVPLVEDNIVLVCSQDDPLASFEQVSINILKHERFLMLDSSSSVYKLCENKFQEAGYKPNIICTNSRHMPLLAMVEEGLGISLLPRKLIIPETNPSLKCIALKENLKTITAMIRPKNKKGNPMANALFNYFKESSL